MFECAERFILNITQVSKTLTCATRPFQTSAFVFKPHGDCPSLKFQRLSSNAVVELMGLAVACAVVLEIGDAGQNACVPLIRSTKKTARDEKQFFLNDIVDVLY